VLVSDLRSVRVATAADGYAIRLVTDPLPLLPNSRQPA
jgi:hypothetical protein